MELTIAPIKKLMKRAGAKRVSDEAAAKLADVLEKRAINICKQADRLAKLSGRKTVMKKDIRIAAKS